MLDVKQNAANITENSDKYLKGFLAVQKFSKALKIGFISF